MPYNTKYSTINCGKLFYGIHKYTNEYNIFQNDYQFISNVKLNNIMKFLRFYYLLKYLQNL